MSKKRIEIKTDIPMLFLLGSLLILVLVLSYTHIEKLEDTVREQQETIDMQDKALRMKQLESQIMNQIYNR